MRDLDHTLTLQDRVSKEVILQTPSDSRVQCVVIIWVSLQSNQLSEECPISHSYIKGIMIIMLLITYSDIFIIAFPLSFSPLFPFHSCNHHTVVHVHESYLYKLHVYFCTHDQKAGFFHLWIRHNNHPGWAFCEPATLPGTT